MSKEKYTAIILGASGLIGYNLLQLLIKDERYSHIYTISRYPLSIKSTKISQIIADIDNIESKLQDLAVDIFFCTIGSTKKKTPNEKDYYTIDHDYPIRVAKILQHNGCKTISIVSSIGADKNSNNFYLKLKGNVEKSVIHLNYENTQIFRPSLLIGKRKEKRFLEQLGQIILPFINLFLIGNLNKYRSIEANTVAKAMSKLAIIEQRGIFIYQTEEIKQNA